MVGPDFHLTCGFTPPNFPTVGTQDLGCAVVLLKPRKSKSSGAFGVIGLVVALTLTACNSDSAESSQSSDTASLLFTVTSGGSRIKAADDGGFLLLLDHQATLSVVEGLSVLMTYRPMPHPGKRPGLTARRLKQIHLKT